MAGTTNAKQKDEKGYESYTEKGRETMAAAADTAAAVGQKAAEVASSVGDKAGEVASRIGQKAEETSSAVGGTMKSLAGTIREKAPQSGVLGNVSSGVADKLETSGRYLEEHGLGGMAKDMTDMIRRNPLPALLIGIGLGYLLARATHRS
jgi:hypothetical protein